MAKATTTKRLISSARVAEGIGQLTKQQEREPQEAAGSIRKRINGTAERPRLTVFRASQHIYAQAIDDTHDRRGRVLRVGHRGEARQRHGQEEGRAPRRSARRSPRSASEGRRQVVFDRNGFIYHGRVKEVADGAREAGLKF